MCRRAIFVTGAGGIVGRHFVESMLREGHTVFGTARAPTCSGLHQDRFVCADLSDERSTDAIEALLAKWHGDITIVHLAAAIPHSRSYADEDACGITTRRIDANMRHLQERLRCRMIYMSTGGIYDHRDPAPKIAGVSKASGASPYFDAKLDGEALVVSGGNTAVFRLSAPIGAGIPAALAVRKMARSLRETGIVHIWGTGKREQDFIDVRDVSALLCHAALGPCQSGVFNLASGVTSSMIEVGQALIAAFGRGEIIFDGIDPNEGMFARYDITSTCDTFEWEPEISLQSSCAFWLKELVSI